LKKTLFSTGKKLKRVGGPPTGRIKTGKPKKGKKIPARIKRGPGAMWGETRETNEARGGRTPMVGGGNTPGGSVTP